MIRFILNKILRKFEADYDYDTAFMRDVAEIWPGAALRYLALSTVSGMRGPAPEIWAGALLASTLDGDCGPCAQLVVGFAQRAGVPDDHIAACLVRDFGAAGTMGLGFRFAEAAIADHPEADELREDIRATHGEQAAIAAAYAAASGRAYPVMKRALGHGRECRQIKLGGVLHSIVRSPE
ncbi:hypothetical protein A8B82_08455 [Sulfitobacter sp. EhC04]|uniref:hypothetical protein n=1 Tax=Sulfitobacter sp. EhC04 TaxID=1849168 RepID=UPI0007F52D15|nr:hypothetical protein [Sulfitobacter sp. EhC04]OAN79155.1 hypothetical protein A8B82_08455 [Sulfitobacter sp. EhC04]